MQISSYLSKNSFLPQCINEPPNPELGIVVVIPSYKEPELLCSLEALNNCILPSCGVEVAVVINLPEDAGEKLLKETRHTIQKVKEWIEKRKDDTIRFFLIEAFNLPLKTAGVGLARKIGMDEALRRFDFIKNPEGIIVCFDADSLCQENYLVEIEKAFRNNPKAPGASIYFEHPLKGKKFAPSIFKAIYLYELHLRYYIAGLRFAGYPFAFHTIGSSMAVRAKVYQKQGGMNKRKAGEDFYFLHKIIPLGNYIEINSTRVIPSPRPSDRVPFGTGKAVNAFLAQNDDEMLTYNPEVFKILRSFLQKTGCFYKAQDADEAILSDLPVAIRKFLLQEDFLTKLKEIKKHSTNWESFNKRFFSWFNGLKVLKMIHFFRDHYTGTMEVNSAAKELKEIISPGNYAIKDLLEFYREADRNNQRRYPLS